MQHVMKTAAVLWEQHCCQSVSNVCCLFCSTDRQCVCNTEIQRQEAHTTRHLYVIHCKDITTPQIKENPAGVLPKKRRWGATRSTWRSSVGAETSSRTPQPGATEVSSWWCHRRWQAACDWVSVGHKGQATRQIVQSRRGKRVTWSRVSCLTSRYEHLWLVECPLMSHWWCRTCKDMKKKGRK